MSKRVTLLGRSRRNFFTGLAVVLPVIISIAVALWLFNQAVAVSDILLFPFNHIIPGLEVEHIWKDAVDGSVSSLQLFLLVFSFIFKANIILIAAFRRLTHLLKSLSQMSNRLGKGVLLLECFFSCLVF